MNYIDDMGREHAYRKKWKPGNPEDYSEYWDMEDAYGCAEFYEVHPKDEENVIIKFFRGNEFESEKEIEKRDLKRYEMWLGDFIYYREVGERLCTTSMQ